MAWSSGGGDSLDGGGVIVLVFAGLDHTVFVSPNMRTNRCSVPVATVPGYRTIPGTGILPRSRKLPKLKVSIHETS